MPKLIYICQPETINFRQNDTSGRSIQITDMTPKTLILEHSQINIHSKLTIECVRSIYDIPDNNIKYINVKFEFKNSMEVIRTKKNFYAALFHTFLIAEPYDVVLINMAFIHNTKELPLVFDKVIFDMCSNLMSRNIAVVISAGNSNIDIGIYVNPIPNIFNFIKINATSNPSAIIVGGKRVANITSNYGEIVNCYFPEHTSSFGKSSAAAAKAAAYILKMQEFAKTTLRYLNTSEIKAFFLNNNNNPDWATIQSWINSKL